MFGAIAAAHPFDPPPGFSPTAPAAPSPSEIRATARRLAAETRAEERAAAEAEVAAKRAAERAEKIDREKVRALEAQARKAMKRAEQAAK